MALDDLHDRPHAAHLLPETCRVLAGTRYALLRDEFAMFREISLARKKKNRFRQPENTKRVNQFRWRGQRQLHAIHIEIIGKTQFRQPENNRSDGQNRAPYQQHSPIRQNRAI